MCITLSVVTMGVRGADTHGNSVMDTFWYLSRVPMVSAIYIYRVIYTELKEGRYMARPSPPVAQRVFFGGGRSFRGFSGNCGSGAREAYSTAAKRLRRRMFTAPMLLISSILIWV